MKRERADQSYKKEMDVKSVSTLALGAALVLGVAAPTLAKKEKPVATPAAYTPKLSAPFRKVAQAVDVALKASDIPGATAALATAEASASTPDDKYVVAQFRLQLSGKTNDKAMQARAIDEMVASGSELAAKDIAKLHFYSGQSAYEAGNYPKAVQELTESDRLGYKEGDPLLLLAEANFKAKQVPAGLAAVDRAIQLRTAAGQKAPEAWYARAASVAYNAKMTGDASKWTREQVRAYPTAQNWRSALVIYRDGAKLDGSQNLDLYRLMRATKSLDGERDYFEYAALASERGLPGEAKSVIEEGQASGKVPATSRPLTELRAAANAKVANDRASLAASERTAGTAANGRLAANTADAYLAYGDNAKAIGLYRTALSKGGIDADAVNLRLGIALARSGDKAGAQTAFAAVTGARSEVAKFWMLYLDTQVT